MSSFIDAYREYLDRMIEQSDDLMLVDIFTVPLEVDPNNPALLEFGDFV